MDRKTAKEFILKQYKHSRYARYKNEHGKTSILEVLKLYRKQLAYSALGIFLAFVVLTIGTYIYFAQDISSKDRLLNHNNTGITLLDDQGNPFFTFDQPKTIRYTNIVDIPVSMQQAVVAAEDKGFYTNAGFSLRGIARAFVVDISGGQLAQGGSTITQELVKNALLNSNKNFLRKFQEFVLAVEIDRRYSKQDILELYLNSVYFGEGAFGVENAAQAYFGKDSKQLDLAQTSLLTGLLPAPSYYDPIANGPTAAIAKQHIVLKEMVANGSITQTQADAAMNEKLIFIAPQKDETVNELAPHFALYVKKLIDDKYGDDTAVQQGFKVKTTLNSQWQTYAEQVVKNQVTYLLSDKATNGAVVVLDPKTGAIKVMVGSYDWNDPKFGKANMAISPRQPGSSFKPIIYGKAIEDHLITAATILQDVPTDFGGGYKPLDYDKSFRGPVTVRRALDNSLNIPAVEVMQKLGVANGVNEATQFGITTMQGPSQYGLSLVLGTAEIPLLEMTSAYSAFANQGDRNDTFAISEITNKYGDTIFTNTPVVTHVIDKGVAFIISSILSDNATRAEEFGNALTISRTAAVKTGTTENFRDALTIGYTPSLVVGVWVGNNDNTPMDNIAGSLGAAPIWRLLMTQYLQHTPLESFQIPDDVVQKPACPYGLPTITPSPTPLPPGSKPPVQTLNKGIYNEYFLTGTEPKECSAPTPSPSPTHGPTNTPAPTSTPQPQNPTNTPAPTIEVTLPITTPTGILLTPTNTPTPTKSQ